MPGAVRRPTPASPPTPPRPLTPPTTPDPPTAPRRAPRRRSRCPRRPRPPCPASAELLPPANPAPLVTTPLPRGASAQGRLVRQFPDALRPPRGARVESSSLSPMGDRLQVGLVATTALSPAQVLLAYRTRLGRRGMDEHGGPAERRRLPGRRVPPGRQRRDRHGQPARLRVELRRPRLAPRRGRVSGCTSPSETGPPAAQPATPASTPARPSGRVVITLGHRLAPDRRLLGVGLRDPPALPHRGRRAHAGGVRLHRRPLPGRERAGPPRRRLAGRRLGPAEVGRLPRLRRSPPSRASSCSSPRARPASPPWSPPTGSARASGPRLATR